MGTAGKIVVAWFITLPASAAVGAVAASIASWGLAGLVIDAVVGAAVIAGIFVVSRRRPHDQGSAIEVDVAATSVLSRRRARRAERRGRVDTRPPASRRRSSAWTIHRPRRDAQRLHPDDEVRS